MRILVVSTACIKDRDIQYDLYEYFACQGNPLLVFAPQYADVTKGGICAPREEKVGNLTIERIYKDIPVMWGEPNSGLKEAQSGAATLRMPRMRSPERSGTEACVASLRRSPPTLASRLQWTWL